MAPLLVKAVCARSGDQNVKGQLLVMGLLRTFLPNVFCERKAECQSLRQTEIFKRGSQRNTVKLLRPTGNVIDIVFVWSRIVYSSWVLFSLHRRTLKAASANLV